MPKLLTELIHEVIQCLAIPYLNDNDRNALLTSHPVFRAWKRCMWLARRSDHRQTFRRCKCFSRQFNVATKR